MNTWTCVCDADNLASKKSCSVCGARRAKLAKLEPATTTPAWVPRGPRPCTDVENKACIQIIQAVLAKQMPVTEAEAHLHTIFQGRELP